MRPVTHWMPYAWHRNLHKKPRIKQAERLARKIEKVVYRRRINWPVVVLLAVLLSLAVYGLLT